MSNFSDIMSNLSSMETAERRRTSVVNKERKLMSKRMSYFDDTQTLSKDVPNQQDLFACDS